MVKKTKRFKYEAKKSAKEYVVHDEPKPEPAIVETISCPIYEKRNPSMNKKHYYDCPMQAGI